MVNVVDSFLKERTADYIAQRQEMPPKVAGSSSSEYVLLRACAGTLVFVEVKVRLG